MQSHAEHADSKIPLNILLVDDQPAKLLSYGVILRELGDNLIRASSGREALEKLLKSDIAIVITDVSMPGIGGFDLADMMHQHPRFQNTPIIFVSAVCLSDLDRLKGYRLGAVDYISVPIVPELLRAKIRVFADLHRKTRQLELLNTELCRISNRLMGAQDEERRRIARELHDGLGQELAAARMILDQIFGQTSPQQANDLRQIIDHATEHVRNLSHLLHPPLLDEVGLFAALRCYLDGFTKRSRIRTALEVRPANMARLAPELEMAMFRIVQEALTNVFRHSAARNVSITIVQRSHELVLIVNDDGKGIDAEITKLRPDRLGVGIAGMQQRAKDLGGEFRVANGNPGTVLEVIVPHSGAGSRELSTVTAG
jgi:signal transduction histidine kinase